MQKKITLLSAILCLFLLVSSCSVQNLLFNNWEQEEKSRLVAINKLDQFVVESIDIDYIVNCKARIKAEKESFSGACHLILTRKKELQLTVQHPLGGTILKIYADHSTIQLNDFAEKKSYRFKTTTKQNLIIPIIRDLSLDELQAILWGRLTATAGESLEYEIVDNKPIRMIKRNGSVQLDIVYKRWLEYNRLPFPAMIEISNQVDGSSLRLVITQFEPGFVRERLTLEQLFPSQPDRSF